MEKFHRRFEISCCSHLPEELVIEILLRLPVESLVRSKAVCKYWYNVITSSDFIKNHFNHHRNSNHARILVYHYIPSPTFEKGFAVFSGESLTRLHHDLDYLRIPHNMRHILGPVNGLFLLCQSTYIRPYNYPLALFNPATRQLRPIIVPDSSQKTHVWSCLHAFGFCFDPLTNDFKVVAFWDFRDHRTGFPIGLIKISVYSLANDSWKHLDPDGKTRHKTPCAYSGTTYFNSACLWLSQNFKSDHSILSFDISSEVLREINGPQNTVSKSPFLFLYNNDSLAMFLSTHVSSRIGSIDLLVMKEDGCWTKQLTVDVSLLGVIQPLGLWKNSKLFLETITMPHLFDRTNPSKLVLYDPMTHETEELLGIQYSDTVFLQLFSYNESLVSFKAGCTRTGIDIAFQMLSKDFCCVLKRPMIFVCLRCMTHASGCTCGRGGRG